MLVGQAPGIWGVHRPDRDEPPAPRQQVTYTCTRGHAFEVTLSAEAEPPAAWDCRCGAIGRPAGQLLVAADSGISDHERRMAQLLERRTRAELEEILAARLGEVAARRRAGQL